MKRNILLGFRKLINRSYSPTLIGLTLTIIIVVPLSFFLNVYKDFNDILVEGHGLIFDILVFGILIQILINKNSKKDRISRFEETITDYRGLKTDEARVIIFSNFKKLVNEGKYSIWLNNCYLKGSRFYGIKYLKESLFIESILTKSRFEVDLYECSFAFAKMKKSWFIHNRIDSNFNSSNLAKSRFQHCNLENSNFWNANLKDVLFEACDLSDCNFDKANIDGTHFFQSKNLKIEQLLKCRNLDKAILPEELEERYNDIKNTLPSNI